MFLLAVPIEKGMETHSSILAWRIPWTEEPGGLQFMESQRVGLSYLHFHFIATLQNVIIFLPIKKNRVILFFIFRIELY